MENWYFEFNNDAYPYILALGGFLIILTLVYYRRTIPQLPTGWKITLTVFRSIVMLLISLLLCFPSLVLTEGRFTGRKLAVLIDKSGSMAFEENGTVRMESVRKYIENKNSKILNEEIVLLPFSSYLDEDVRDSTIKPDSNLTSIGSAIKSVISSDHLLEIGGILIISDGVNNLGPDPVFEAIRSGVPVSAIGVGDTLPLMDIAIDDVKSQEIVYRGENIDFELFLRSDISNEVKAVVELYDGSRKLKTTTVSLPGGGAIQDFKLSIPADSIGEFNYRFVLKGDFAEKFTGNNYRSTAVTVLKDRVNLLLAGEKPEWEYTFLKRILISNDKYKVSNYLPGVGGKKILIADNDNVSDYDCIIIVGSADNTYSKYSGMLSNLLKVGKLKVFLLLSPETAGSRFELILRKIGIISSNGKLHALTGQFLPEVENRPLPDALLRTEKGRNQVPFSELPPVGYRLNGFTPDQDWDVVINSVSDRGDLEPLLMKGNIKGNRIVVMNGGPIWKWYFYMQRPGYNEENYSILIENIVTWLTVGGQAEPIGISTDKRLYNAGDDVRFSARVFDDNYRAIMGSSVIVNINDDNGKRILELREIDDGIFEGAGRRLPAGEYKYSAEVSTDGKHAKTIDGSFKIQKYSEEYRRINADRRLLMEIAQKSGGKYYNIEDVPTESFPLKRDKITIRNPINIASLPAIIIIMILLLAVEWAVRKRKQLP
ncbi:MAG: hypothetical protein GY855_07985 [candidate division Zixibacteria bacterium]|nr:hypothetical protein [candidate division Zixibacteria bacterium]